MATARRLYLYGVSAAGLGLLLWGTVTMLHLVFAKAGLGPQNFGGTLSSDGDKEALAQAISVGVIGMVLWISHWTMVERMVHRKDETGAAERASIVRSVYFAALLSTSLTVAVVLAVQLISNSVGNRLESQTASNSGYVYSVTTSFADDAWSLALIVVFFVAWAYNAWVRARDFRQGTFIGGAAAWVSRFYLYGAALMGLLTVLGNVTTIIALLGSMVLLDNTGEPSSWWMRPLSGALIGLVFWTGVWLIHWLYSNRLRSGHGEATEQNVAERTSRVRVAYLLLVVFWGALVVVENFSSSLGNLFEKLLGYDMPSSELGYILVVPALCALPAAGLWFLHRRRAIGESVEGPAGVSARRISSYAVAIIGIYAIGIGAAEALMAAFGQIFAPVNSNSIQDQYAPSFEVWKMEIAAGLAVFLVGLIIWVWPWFSAQHRRSFGGEVGSSSRSYYLYLIAGVSILAAAGSLVFLMYLYLRLGLGLTDPNLASEVSAPLAFLLVAVVLLGYHSLVMRGDGKPPKAPAYAMPVPPQWPGYPSGYAGPGAYPPVGPTYVAPGAYPPPPAPYAPMAPMAPVPVAPMAPMAPVPVAPVAPVTPDATLVVPASPEASPAAASEAEKPSESSPETGG
jgi:hypothetical protein